MVYRSCSQRNGIRSGFSHAESCQTLPVVFLIALSHLYLAWGTCSNALSSVAMQWFLEGAHLLHHDFCGFRSVRGTADWIAKLAPSLDDPRHSVETAITVFLNIERAFNSIFHDVIISSVSHLGIIANIFRFFVSSFSDSTYCVRLGTITSSVRLIGLGVPQVPSPIIFNTVLTTSRRCVSSCPRSSYFRTVIYADDICL